MSIYLTMLARGRDVMLAAAHAVCTGKGDAGAVFDDGDKGTISATAKVMNINNW